MLAPAASRSAPSSTLAVPAPVPPASSRAVLGRARRRLPRVGTSKTADKIKSVYIKGEVLEMSESTTRIESLQRRVHEMLVRL